MKKSLTAIILTFNEEKHIERCIISLLNVCTRICIVDSFSNDKTIQIAQKYNIDIYQNKWENNYAKQFNWALSHCNIQTNWVMRLDADEYVLPELANEINNRLYTLSDEYTGVILNRRVIYKNKWIKHGGFYPLELLRIWRFGLGQCEQRLMDEHIILSKGKVLKLKNDFVDENLNDIHWWINKHNNYARREAVDLLNIKYGLTEKYSLSQNQSRQVVAKRLIKEKIYEKLPLGWRAFLYYIFRIFIKFGFLDGGRGMIFHFLQGFWYRMIVDINISEIESRTRKDKNLIREIIINEWNVSIK